MLSKPQLLLHKLLVLYKGETNNKKASYTKQYVSQIVGAVAHQEGITEDPDPAEEDRQAARRVQGLLRLSRHSQER